MNSSKGPKLSTETENDRVYLDRISDGHMHQSEGDLWMKCLIQPVAVPNLEHCGIRTVFNSFKGVDFDEDDFDTDGPLDVDSIRYLVSKKYPFQSGASARSKLPPLEQPESESNLLDGKHGNNLSLFQSMLDSAYEPNSDLTDKKQQNSDNIDIVENTPRQFGLR